MIVKRSCRSFMFFEAMILRTIAIGIKTNIVITAAAVIQPSDTELILTPTYIQLCRIH
jgi:hypothetical protein